MADLIVHDIDVDLLQSLCGRASKHGCSIDAECRRILIEALYHLEKRSLAEVLAEMPELETEADFGKDEYFARINA